MEHRIDFTVDKKLVGKHMKMSYADNKTRELWMGFMPHRKEIKNKLSDELISMQVYDNSFDFKNFNINAPFEKWAAVEVASVENVPDEMETFVLPGGLYAIFLYKGLPSEGQKAFQFIFDSWLPLSGYVLDQRPHFEVLGEKYKNGSPDSEEEIWIPVKLKNTK